MCYHYPVINFVNLKNTLHLFWKIRVFSVCLFIPGVEKKAKQKNCWNLGFSGKGEGKEGWPISSLCLHHSLNSYQWSNIVTLYGKKVLLGLEKIQNLYKKDLEKTNTNNYILYKRC